MPEPKQTPRSRVIGLGVLLALLIGVVAFTWRPAASPVAGPSNQPREQRRQSAAGVTAPGDLDVRLEALKQAPPNPGGETRNPFRFYVKPPPPPPPPPPVVQRPPPPPQPKVGDEGYVPPPPPPIPLKFIGTLEQGRKKVAIFSDGRGLPVYASEGEMVMGQYKLVRIGIESVVMEYPDGRGRQTIPMRGQ